MRVPKLEARTLNPEKIDFLKQHGANADEFCEFLQVCDRA
jgi:hypothetical protein